MGRTSRFRSLTKQVLIDQRGLSNLEYGIILSLIAVSSMGALEALGLSVRDGFSGAGAAVASNNDAFNGGGSAGDTNPVDGDSGNGSTGSDSGTPDEPPVAAADSPDTNDATVDEEPVIPDEPPMAAMRSGPGE